MNTTMKIDFVHVVTPAALSYSLHRIEPGGTFDETTAMIVNAEDAALALEEDAADFDFTASDRADMAARAADIRTGVKDYFLRRAGLR